MPSWSLIVPANMMIPDPVKKKGGPYWREQPKCFIIDTNLKLSAKSC